jgi:hypothetical protein
MQTVLKGTLPYLQWAGLARGVWARRRCLKRHAETHKLSEKTHRNSLASASLFSLCVCVYSTHTSSNVRRGIHIQAISRQPMSEDRHCFALVLLMAGFFFGTAPPQPGVGLLPVIPGPPPAALLSQIDEADRSFAFVGDEHDGEGRGGEGRGGLPVVDGFPPSPDLFGCLDDADRGPVACGVDAGISARYMQTKESGQNPFLFKQCGGGCKSGCFGRVWMHQPEWFAHTEQRRVKLDAAYSSLAASGVSMGALRHTGSASAPGSAQLHTQSFTEALSDAGAHHATRAELDKMREVFVETTSTDLLSPGFLPDMVCVSAWAHIVGVSRAYLYDPSTLHPVSRISEYYATMGGTKSSDFRNNQQFVQSAELLDLIEVEKMDFESGKMCSCDGSKCFCRRLPNTALISGREDYTQERNFKKRNVKLLSILWHESMHQPSSLHEDYVHQWLGVSVRKIRALRALAQAAVDKGDFKLEKAIMHGSVAKSALNKFAPQVRSSIATFLDIHTRTDPTKPRLICTSQEMHGVSGMFEHLHDFFPEVVISRTSFFRYVKDILSDQGLEPKIRATKGDHNVCHVCKVLNDRRSELMIAIKKCDVDLGGWGVGGTFVGKLKCGIDFHDRVHLVNYRSLLQNEWDKAEKLFCAHEKLDKDMRKFLAGAVVAAQTAERNYQRGDGGVGEATGWRSKDTMRVIHIDDRR